MTLKGILEAVGGPLHLQSKDELIRTIEAVSMVHGFNSAYRDTLRGCRDLGPLFDGDVPSKSARDDLVEMGAIAKVYVNGEDGYNACTYYGGLLMKAVEELNKPFGQPQEGRYG